jgi:Protein of unknown function (DUF4232)
MLTRTHTIIACASAAMAAAVMAAPFAAEGATQAAVTNAAASAPACTAADLGVWVAADQSDGAAGTVYYPLEFTNLSKQTCTLYGFPTVSAIAANGHQLGRPAAPDHAVQPSAVRLTPAATAYAALGYSDVITGNCPNTSKRVAYELRVYPPGQTQSDHVFWDLPACTARGSSMFMRVRVIAPGPGIAGDTG